MLTLIMAVKTTLEFGGGPDAYAFPLTEEVLLKFKQRIENAKLFSADENFDCFQFYDVDGKWINSDPDAIWYEDVVSFGETKIADIDFKDLEPFDGFSLRLCRIDKYASLTFLSYEDGGADEWFTEACVNWDWLMEQVPELKGKLVC